MSDLKLSLLLAALIALFCAVLYRFIGAPAGGIAVAGLINVYQGYLRQRRIRREQAVVEIRVEDPSQQAQMLTEISDASLRASVERRLRQDGAVVRDGDTEVFPFPQSVVASVRSQYWLFWLIAAFTMGLAAFVPDLSTLWRLVLLGAGLLSMVGVWRRTRMERYLLAAVEIAPSQVTQVWNDGLRYSVPFYPPIRIESSAESDGLLLHSNVRPHPMHISKHLVGFQRLRALLYQFSGSPLPHDSAS